MTDVVFTPTNHGDLGWLLTSFARGIPVVEAVLAVSIDGLAIAASENVERAKVDQLAAITSGLASLTTSTASLLGTGRVRQTVVDMDGGVLLVMAIGDRALLAVQAGTDADLGQIGYEMALLVQRVFVALEPNARQG